MPRTIRYHEKFIYLARKINRSLFFAHHQVITPQREIFTFHPSVCLFFLSCKFKLGWHCRFLQHPLILTFHPQDKRDDLGKIPSQSDLCSAFASAFALTFYLIFRTFFIFFFTFSPLLFTFRRNILCHYSWSFGFLAFPVLDLQPSKSDFLLLMLDHIFFGFLHFLFSVLKHALDRRSSAFSNNFLTSPLFL